MRWFMLKINQNIIFLKYTTNLGPCGLAVKIDVYQTSMWHILTSICSSAADLRAGYVVSAVGYSQGELVCRAGLQVRDYHRGHSGVKCKSLPVLAGQNRKDVVLHPSLQILQCWKQKI